jgi:hypothetical protein
VPSIGLTDRLQSVGHHHQQQQQQQQQLRAKLQRTRQSVPAVFEAGRVNPNRPCWGKVDRSRHHRAQARTRGAEAFCRRDEASNQKHTFSCTSHRRSDHEEHVSRAARDVCDPLGCARLSPRSAYPVRNPCAARPRKNDRATVVTSIRQRWRGPAKAERAGRFGVFNQPHLRMVTAWRHNSGLRGQQFLISKPRDQRIDEDPHLCRQVTTVRVKSDNGELNRRVVQQQWHKGAGF